MKNIFFLLLLLSSSAFAQDISSKSNDVLLDFSDPKKNYSTGAPSIKWLAPGSEISYVKDGKLPVRFSVNSKKPLKSVTLIIRDKVNNEVKGSTPIKIDDNSKLSLEVNRTLTLPEGIDLIEIEAKNEDDIITSSIKTAYSGEEAVSAAVRLDRKDYALIFVTDRYDNWTPLSNPVFDGRTIQQSLEKNYSFITEVVENPTREEVFLKLREYATKKYNKLDQLMIFFAGHGMYDDTFKEGFIVPREALQNDPSKTSYIRYSELKTTVNNNPCEHIMMVMDVCFGGTFDDEVATGARGDMDAYAEVSRADMVSRKLEFKTRRYITSGGKVYVPDGTPGSHSPFAKQFITALESKGGDDGILTTNELYTYLEKLKTAPQFGKFGSDQLNSEFLFVVK